MEISIRLSQIHRIQSLVIGLIAVVFSCFWVTVEARKFSYTLQTSVVGSLNYLTPENGDNFFTLGRKYSFGFTELVEANPEVDPWVPFFFSSSILLPGMFILPKKYLHTTQPTVFINLSEMRLYFLRTITSKKRAGVIYTYPVSIGKDAWLTPEGKTTVVDKLINPAWYPSAAQIKESIAHGGEALPSVVLSGEKNPLGKLALQLGIRGYFVHGTNREYSIGLKATHGCIRLHNEAIEKLIEVVERGTHVEIHHTPLKVARAGPILYLEAHTQYVQKFDYEKEVDAVVKELARLATLGKNEIRVDWKHVFSAIDEGVGYPVSINFVSKKANLTSAPAKSTSTAATFSLQDQGGGATKHHQSVEIYALPKAVEQQNAHKDPL